MPRRTTRSTIQMPLTRETNQEADRSRRLTFSFIHDYHHVCDVISDALLVQASDSKADCY